MNEMICLDTKYSTTRLLTQKKPAIENSAENKIQSVLCLPRGENRKGEGGLRTKGYFKSNQIDKPLITVVTVVFNEEKILEKTIQSVIGQSYNNVEYIIVDGGSTDGTLDIILKFEHLIDYWVSEKDSGIYNAMNKGIDVAGGEWINFMNSGDLFYQNSTIEFIFNRNILGNIIYGNTLYLYKSNIKRIRKSSDYPKFKYGIPFCHQSTFVKTKNMKFYKFSETYRIYADFDFFLKLMIDGEAFIYMDLTISIFNCEGASSENHLQYLKERYNIMKKYNVFNAVLLVINIFSREILKKILPYKFIRWIQIFKWSR